MPVNIILPIFAPANPNVEKYLCRTQSWSLCCLLKQEGWQNNLTRVNRRCECQAMWNAPHICINWMEKARTLYRLGLNLILGRYLWKTPSQISSTWQKKSERSRGESTQNHRSLFFLWVLTGCFGTENHYNPQPLNTLFFFLGKAFSPKMTGGNGHQVSTSLTLLFFMMTHSHSTSKASSPAAQVAHCFRDRSAYNTALSTSPSLWGRELTGQQQRASWSGWRHRTELQGHARCIARAHAAQGLPISLQPSSCSLMDFQLLGSSQPASSSRAGDSSVPVLHPAAYTSLFASISIMKEMLISFREAVLRAKEKAMTNLLTSYTFLLCNTVLLALCNCVPFTVLTCKWFL